MLIGSMFMVTSGLILLADRPGMAQLPGDVGKRVIIEQPDSL
jgi:hypothetical protein